MASQLQNESRQEAEIHKRRIGLLARATQGELREFFGNLRAVPAASMVRGPETGLIMIRGRMGGTGNLFNLGETTVTRATIRLENGLIGHSQRLGGDTEAARIAAILDALCEMEEFSQTIDAFLSEIATRIENEDRALAEETAATRVNFFTMVRGDD